MSFRSPSASHATAIRSLARGGACLAVVALASAVCLTTSTLPAQAATPFVDVPADDAFATEITFLAQAGIVDGFSTAEFRPRAPATRQAVAAWLYRHAGSPPVPPTAPSFTDVPPSHPFFAEISWLASEGISSGFDDGTFRPAATLSRQGAASFLFHYAHAVGVPVGSPSFADVPDTHPLHDEIGWLAAAGITDGYSNGTFRPTAILAREAMVAFLYRYDGRFAARGTTSIVSVNDAGEVGFGAFRSPSVSADGRYVAFESDSDTLVPGQFNWWPQVFVRDTTLGTTTLVSANPSGLVSNNEAKDPSISADGRYVAFESLASDLVEGDENEGTDVFVRDLVTGTTVLASTDVNGGFADGQSFNPSISSDGDRVAFDSTAPDLVAVDLADGSDVFVRDLVAGTTSLVSVDLQGSPAQSVSEASVAPSLSADGNVVAFTSAQPDLVSGDLNDASDVFVRDLTTLQTTLVSVGAAYGAGASSVSADGSFVAYEQMALGGLVDGLYRRDVIAGTTDLVSINSNGVAADGYSIVPSISSDGRYVAFTSQATNLGAHGAHLVETYDVFRRDLQAGITSLVSPGDAGAPAAGDSFDPAISADGAHIVFFSAAPNLVPGVPGEGIFLFGVASP